MNICRWILTAYLVQSLTLGYALAPKSQADKNLLYEFNAENLLKEGYILYSESGQDTILAFFLGRFHDYYQIDIFDLTTKERVGYVDFSIHNFEFEKWGGLTSALVLWQDRIYSRSAEQAASEYGLALKDLKDVNAFRESAPVNPPPAYYIRSDFTKHGKLKWHHLSDVMMGIAIYAAIKEGVDDLTLDPEESLHRSLFYERRFGVLPQKGWYLRLYSIAYEKLGRVNLGGMIFDFRVGKFSPMEEEENLPGPLDVFVESIPSLHKEDLQKIDKDTKGGQFPDRHVWSFLKAVSDLMGGNSQERLKSWLSESLQARGRNTIEIPLSLGALPKEWRRAALLLLQKEMIKMNFQFGDLEFSEIFESERPLPSNDNLWRFARSA